MTDQTPATDLACTCANGDGTSHPKYHATSCPIAQTPATEAGRPYGPDNPAPGTRLWRFRNYPETLTHEGWVAVAHDLDQLRAEARASLDVWTVAAALHDTAVPGHNVGEGPLRAVCFSIESHVPRATAISAILAEYK